jgi:antitoxin component of MazEF toxin-antitoxin module
LPTQSKKGNFVINVPVRKLGSTAYVVIPEEALQALGIGVGSKLDFDVAEGTLLMRPAAKSRAHPIAELLQGQVGRAAKGFRPALKARPVPG